VPAFFANLLPEGALRRMIAETAGVGEDQDMRLLAHLGEGHARQRCSVVYPSTAVSRSSTGSPSTARRVGAASTSAVLEHASEHGRLCLIVGCSEAGGGVMMLRWRPPNVTGTSPGTVAAAAAFGGCAREPLNINLSL